jgi:transcription antitermination protein NusB
MSLKCPPDLDGNNLSRPDRRDTLPRPRTVSRIAAVQAWFQKEHQNMDIADILKEFQSYRFSSHKFYWIWGERFFIDTNYFTALLSGLNEHEEPIHHCLTRVLPPLWPLERLDILSKTVIKLGTLELLYMEGVEKGTIINEYVNIAHSFLSEKSPGFVNAVLDSLPIQKTDDQGDTPCAPLSETL